MRKMPQLPAVQKQTRMTTNFLGYNHQEIIEDGEMYDMQNMSGRLYPMLAPRKKRGITVVDPQGTGMPLNTLYGLHGRDQLVHIVGRDVYYALQPHPVQGIQVSTEESMLPKKIVSFGAYVCIWPDRVYFNTANLDDAGLMYKDWDNVSGGGYKSMTLTLCRADGTNYDAENITVSVSPPPDAVNGDLWIDQSGDVDVLKQYMEDMEEWLEIATTYIKIESAGIGSGLKEYDVVEISGLAAASTVTDQKVVEQIKMLNTTNIVYYCGENYIVVAGILSRSQDTVAQQRVQVNLDVPDMDFVCESNNRLWGCKYGLRNGETVNEIYASALGDFRNWNRFMGNSQDSWSASVGTDGPFTGAIAQRGYPVFFKEGYIHRVSGSLPSNFSITTTACRGVQAGSWRSVQVVNEAIYYKSRQGVMRYDGSMPDSVGDQLGEILYSDARAGVLFSRYYISMKDRNNEWHQFVYDTEKGTWHKEDNFHAMCYGSVGDELFAIDEDHNTIVTMDGSMGELEDDFEWSATFGLQGAEYGRGTYGSRIRNDLSAKLYMSRFLIRIYIEPETTVKLEIKYMDGDWEKVGEITGDKLDSYLLPVIPRRCDHLRFRISGRGDTRIYSIARQLEVASDA